MDKIDKMIYENDKIEIKDIKAFDELIKKIRDDIAKQDPREILDKIFM